MIENAPTQQYVGFHNEIRIFLPGLIDAFSSPEGAVLAPVRAARYVRGARATAWPTTASLKPSAGYT